jgi:hypothetical protein
MTGIAATIGAALAIAAVSTFGDFVWAMWIPRPRTLYGLAHGTLLFLCIGLVVGSLARKPAIGAVAGALIGGLAAAGFYVLAPLTGAWIMFVLWIGIWVALGVLHGRLNRQQAGISAGFTRGALGAVGSGIAFYAISGIWSPFNPRGWDYLVHFGAWTVAYLPGFAALLIAPAGGLFPKRA